MPSELLERDEELAVAVGPEQGFIVLHGLDRLCANLAASRPLVLSVDDVHRADAPSLCYLAFLLARLEELPVAILAGARPDYDGPGADLVGALVTDPGVVPVRLAPLSRGAVGRLLEDGLGVAPEPGFAEACREATGGVPLLVRALVGALRDDGVDPVAAAATQVDHADRAEAELRASGGKPRRAQLTGIAALTASERRVAELAGQGMTNREIAQAPFVTARTVEGHLTQVIHQARRAVTRRPRRGALNPTSDTFTKGV